MFLSFSTSVGFILLNSFVVCQHGNTHPVMLTQRAPLSAPASSSQLTAALTQRSERIAVVLSFASAECATVVCARARSSLLVDPPV